MAAAAGWSSLPAELLSEIAGSLSADADQLHVRQVCRHWRASTSPLAACRPWIVAGRQPRRFAGPIGDHSFWPPHGGGGGGRRILSRAPAGLPCCCGASHGWLAMTDDELSPTRLVLWEPVSGAEISLPCLPGVAQFFLSGDPHASSPDWMAVTGRMASRSLYDVEGVQRLFFWRPGDAGWTAQTERGAYRMDSAAFHGRRLYFTDAYWNLRAYDLEDFPPKRVWVSAFHPIMNYFGQRCVLRALHVVTCNGDLLLVVLRSGHHPTLAEVHKPDWTGSSSLLNLGERVTDLGEHSLFLGRGDAFALSAKEFPSIRRNCVYFVEHDKIEHERWSVVFDLGSDDWEKIPYPEEHSEDGDRWLAYSWFCPRRPVLKQ